MKSIKKLHIIAAKIEQNFDELEIYLEKAKKDIKPDTDEEIVVAINKCLNLLYNMTTKHIDIVELLNEIGEGK